MAVFFCKRSSLGLVSYMTKPRPFGLWTLRQKAFKSAADVLMVGVWLAGRSRPASWRLTLLSPDVAGRDDRRLFRRARLRRSAPNTGSWPMCHPPCREAHLHFVADRGTAVRIPPADPGNHISATTASYSDGLCSTNGTQTIRTSSREVTVRSILTRPIRERSTLSASTTSPPTTATALGRARPSTSAWVSGRNVPGRPSPATVMRMVATASH